MSLLGGFRVTGPSSDDLIVLERKKSCALLAMLVLDPDRTVTRGKLTAILWEDETETAARHRLRQCLLDLRHRLASVDNDTIRAEGDLIQLASSRFVVDVTRFEECAARGTRAALEEASGLYRGDLLDGFSLDAPAFEEWLRVERERLRSRAIAVMKGVLTHQERAPYTEEAIQVAIRLLALEPFDEAAHRSLMRLYAESGRRSAALRQYEECVELLGRELGVEPEPQTRELYRRLVADRSRPTTAATAGRAKRGPAARPPRSRLIGRSPGDTALVGRDDDLAWLEGLARRAQHGQPQIAAVIGEAGIGKSRLVNELAARTRPRRTEILFGRGREGEETLPFAPWIEALRPALTEDIFDRLPAVTRTDLSRLFVEFAGDSVPPSTGVDDGPRIFEAVASLLRELSARRSTIVVLEDLHWSDDMTIRLLRFVPRSLEGRRVLIVGTARPEEVIDSTGKARHLDILCREPSCASRILSPLSREDTTTLFEALLAPRADASSTALLHRLWTLSEGNPFVIVECARAVRDQPAPDRDRVLDLPEGVRSLTVRSLARLGKRASRLADVAAVVGRDLDVKVLEHAARVSQRELADGLEELVLRRVLREFDGRFEFSHDRIREVAYRRLLEPRRVLLHRQIGEAMEALYAADLAPHYAVIGTHCRQAGDWPKACRYEAQAGFAALTRGAGREALACFDHALEAIVRLPRTKDWRELEVRVRLASNSASLAIGSYEGGRPYLVEAERVAETLADPRWRSRVAAALATCVRAAGELEPALTFGRRGLRIAEDSGDHSLEMAARYILATCEHNAGNFRRSLDYLEPLLEASGSRWSEAFVVDRPEYLPTLALYWTVFCCVQLGEFEHARRMVVEALRAPDVQNDVLQTRALLLHISHGRLLNAMGDFQAAIRAYQAGVAAYREDCHGNFYFALAWGLGLAYALAGRVRESLAQFEEAKAVAAKRGTRAFSGMWLLHSGRALLAAERLDEAARMAREALTVNSKNGERPGEAGALGLLAEVAMRRDPVPGDEMEDYALRALELAESMAMRPLAARCHLRLAWWYARTGRADAARHSAAAESLLDQMGRPRSLDAAGMH